MTCLETPCHTTGHICYYVTNEDKSDKVVFTGEWVEVQGVGGGAGSGRYIEWVEVQGVGGGARSGWRCREWVEVH